MEPENAPLTNLNEQAQDNTSTLSNNVSSPTPSKPQSSKALLATTIICAILAIAGIAFGVYGMLPKPQPAEQSEINQTPSNTEPTEEPTIMSDEEVEITDTYTLRDLDEKIALLHFTNQTDTKLSFSKGQHFEFPLYENGTLEDDFKLMGVIGFLGNNARKIYPAEQETIAADFNLSENQKQMLYDIIDADVVDNKYIDTFGEKPTRRTDVGKGNCGSYYYDQALNSYFNLSGCGGTSSYDSYYYKTKYTQDQNHAYVYMSAVVFDFGSGKLYCEPGSFDNGGSTASCGEVTEKDEYGAFVFDPSTLNPDNLGKYRFVFNKADNGTYYFVKTEKL